MSPSYLPPSVETAPNSPTSASAQAVNAPNTPPSNSVMSTSSTNVATTPSSPSTFVPTPLESIGGVASPSIDELLRPASREFSGSRRAPTEFGSRLANARNLRPDEAPPAPAPRRAEPVPPARSFNNPFPDRDGLFPFWGSNRYLKGTPLFPTERKYPVYISPYDSGGVTPGNKHLPSDSMTMEEFEAKYGAAEVRAKAEAKAKAAEGKDKGKSTATPFPSALADENVVPEAPQGVSISLHSSFSFTNTKLDSRSPPLPGPLQTHPRGGGVQGQN
jgi:hypothetical protein